MPKRLLSAAELVALFFRISSKIFGVEEAARGGGRKQSK